MRLALMNRLARLEEKYGPRPLPWLVLKPGTEPPEDWQKRHSGLVTWKSVEGRQPFPIYEGERLGLGAWPLHLLVPMAGKRPEGEPLPYCLELIPDFHRTHDQKSEDPLS